MHRFLERLARFLSSAVVLIYICGMLLGTGTYFTGQVVGADVNFAFAVGVALAVAVELHSWLSQRLTRALYQQLTHTSVDAEEYGALKTQFKVHFGITTGLVAFSIFNGIAFWALTWPGGAHTWSDWIQITIRGTFIPVAFLAAGFLVGLHHDAGQLLADTAHNMLHMTTKAMAKQWRQRIKAARSRRVDLALIAISLMEDAGDHQSARRIRMIATGLDMAERGESSYALHPQSHAATLALTATKPATPETTDRPPTGPGSPSLAPRPRAKGVMPVAPGSRKVTQLRSGRPRKERRTAYQRVADYLTEHPTASVRAVADGAKVSLSTASKYRNQLLAAQAAQRQQVAQ